MNRKPHHERDPGPSIREIFANLPRHVWDSSAEPPIPMKQYHPLARKAVTVKRKKKDGA
jgi:hypothetical protein